MKNPRATLTISILALVIVAVGIIALIRAPHQGDTTAPTVASSTPGYYVTPPSAAVLKQLAASHGFQAFVSVTNGGFEPATTTIKAGQTIRFTNNADHDVWIGQITAINTPENPNTQSCDVPFNSCHALHPGDFAEFTFPSAGTYYYMDDLDTAVRGAVVVK